MNKYLSFGEQVDVALKNEFVQSHWFVCNTPKLLVCLGAPKLPILMTRKHVLTTMNESGVYKANYHNLGVDVVKQLPDMINNPAVVMKSTKQDDSLVLISSCVDKNNNPIVLPILLNGIGNNNVGQEIRANILTSAYGKEHFKVWLDKHIDSNSILYVNNKELIKLIDIGVELSDRMPTE